MYYSIHTKYVIRHTQNVYPLVTQIYTYNKLYIWLLLQFLYINKFGCIYCVYQGDQIELARENYLICAIFTHYKHITNYRATPKLNNMDFPPIYSKIKLYFESTQCRVCFPICSPAGSVVARNIHR